MENCKFSRRRLQLAVALKIRRLIAALKHVAFGMGVACGMWHEATTHFKLCN